jgi:glycosyltransferase involved in cell wall biosynthesis
MTLVSIVTPSFNQAPYLELAIASVLQQDHPEIEYMLVDGGSTDGSLEIIKRHAGQFAWWVSERDAGQAEAINKGFTHAHGEIAAWLNSDDAYLPGAVSAAVAVFEANPSAVMVYANMRAVDENGRITNALTYRQLSLQELLCFEIIGQPAVFMRRAAFDRVGGLDTSFRFLLDHQLWIKLAAQGRVQHVDQTWAIARYHPMAKNRAQASQFGGEAFRIVDWASQDPGLAPVWRRVKRPARAAAHRVDARYLLDSNHPWSALWAWTQSLAIHPPTALARLNLPASAVLEIIGLHALRRAVLHLRQKHLAA